MHTMIDIDEKNLKELEIRCSEVGKTINELINELVSDYIGYSHVDVPKSINADMMTDEELCDRLMSGANPLTERNSISFSEFTARFEKEHGISYV